MYLHTFQTPPAGTMDGLDILQRQCHWACRIGPQLVINPGVTTLEVLYMPFEVAQFIVFIVVDIIMPIIIIIIIIVAISAADQQPQLMISELIIGQNKAPPPFALCQYIHIIILTWWHAADLLGLLKCR